MQTKNINVVQPSASKNEKNAVAAAMQGAGQNVNSVTQTSTAAVNGSLVNGTILNGIGVNGSSTAGGSTSSVPTIMNGGGIVSMASMNGLNMNGSGLANGVLPTSSMNSSLGTASYNGHNTALSQATVPTSSPYQHLPVTSPYQPLPVTSSQPSMAQSPYVTMTAPFQPAPSVSSPYQPPPLPPRVGSAPRNPPGTEVFHTATAGTGHSAYKPVPPPKPFSGGPSLSTSVTSAAATTAEHQHHHHHHHHQGAGATTAALREQLAAITGSSLVAGPPPLLPHILVTDQGHFHTHSTKFPTGGEEERDQLLNGERQHRYIDGIDNPGLIEDSHMPSFRTTGGGGVHAAHSGIPPEGTLAGVLPSHAQQRPYESPFLSRQPFRPPTGQHHSSAVQHHPPSSTQQPSFTRETWMRNSQGQYAGIVEIHPQQGHVHVNGHVSQHHTSNNGHIPNNNMNGYGHKSNHTEASHNHANSTHHANTHHTHLNGYQDPSVAINNQQNNRTGGTVDENHANDVQERRDDPRKDEKWGSLSRGIAALKYQNIKEKLSHKFSRGDKPEDRISTSQADKHTASQGTNTQTSNTKGNSSEVNGSNSHQDGGGGIQPGPSRDSGRLAKLNTSFRKAIHHSSQKTNLQEKTTETSLSIGPAQGGPIHKGSALPPLYPHSPGQYRTQPVPAPPLSPTTFRAPAPLPAPSPHLSRQHQHEPMNRGLANRRSGSYHHLAQIRQEPPSWRPHHYSVDNLVDAHALPSDHTYSGPAVSSGRGQPAGGEGVGSGGSDSGRGTAGSGGEGRVPNTLDTSLDSAASQRQNNQGHSSGNDSEWIDMTDAELQRIMKKGADVKNGGGLMRRESLAATPPLPPLSPEGTPQPSPHPSPARHRKYSLSYSSGGLNKPDLLEPASRDGGSRGNEEGRTTGNNSQGSSQSTPRRGGNSQTQHSHAERTGNKMLSSASGGHRSQGGPSGGWSRRKEDERQRNSALDAIGKNKNRVTIEPLLTLGPGSADLDTGDITSTTDALDLDSMLDGVTEATSDEDATSAYDPDVHLIRKQLEGLEGMYSEVLKLLGGRRGRHIMGNGGGGMGDLKSSRRRMHGSLSSLPSSIVSSRPGRDKRRVIDDRVRKIGRDPHGKTIHKRFQRLESHVVTLARSVAHLSSEMRTQHLMFQEIESIRGEIASLRTGGNSGGSGGGNPSRGGAHLSWESFRAGIPGLSNPGRVKKLTQFFGDEPPLVRIFLRKLGYEKYANIFEQEKIGMLELPYLTEERLQKIGIPLGPRLRILQEAQGPIRKEGNLSVYVV